MMKRNEIRKIIREEIQNLNESNMSGAIYHFTGYHYIQHILKNNSLKLKSSIGVDAEEVHSRGRMNYASFTTVKNSKVGFPFIVDHKSHVRITIDARKLGYNHKIVPAQYYSSVSLDNWGTYERRFRDENEVRVVSDKGEIKNIAKFIAQIDVEITVSKLNLIEQGEFEEAYGEQFAAIHTLALKRGIPIKYFMPKDYALGKKSSDFLYTYIDALSKKKAAMPQEDESIEIGRRPLSKNDNFIHLEVILTVYFFLRGSNNSIATKRFITHIVDNYSKIVDGEHIPMKYKDVSKWCESFFKTYVEGLTSTYEDVRTRGEYLEHMAYSKYIINFQFSPVQLFTSLQRLLKDSEFEIIRKPLFNAYKQIPIHIKKYHKKDKDEGVVGFLLKNWCGIDYEQK